jgi:chromosome segregation ATPase
MEKKFKKGEAAYLCVRVERVLESNDVYDYTVAYTNYGTGGNSFIAVIKEQLLTVDEVADESGIDWQAKYNEYNEKSEAKIRELATRLNGMAESLREAQEKAINLNTSLKAQTIKNEELEGKNDELETTVSELSVLVDKLRKEIAQREEGWDNVSRNNDIAVYNLNRLCKQREILTDRIIALEAELEAERKKNG